MFTRRWSRAHFGGASAAVLAAVLLASQPAAAATDATLQGHVDGVAGGTTVTATDTVTGHKTTAVVDRNGDYVFLGLRPSTYRVEVAGRDAKQAAIEVGQTVAVDFPDAAKVREVVVRARPRQEVTTQVVATNVTAAQIENLPQNSRNFLSFATLAPGIQLSNPSGAVQVQAGALSPDAVNVFIDGISYKNLGNHGGVFGQNFGQGGNPFPQLSIQEYQVETQNFGAETGQSGSAVINAITKTGGNEFHGSIFNDFQPKAFIDQPYFDKLRGIPKPKYDRDQYGGEIGGPIIKDKLTFYVAAEGVHQSLPGNTGLLPPTTAPINGYPANVVSAVTGVPRVYSFDQHLYFGKLTYYATTNDTVNFETYIRSERNLSDVDGNAALTHARDLFTHVNQYQLNWKHSAGGLLNVLNLAYNESGQSTPTAGSGPSFNLTNGMTGNAGNGAELGAHYFTQADAQKSITFKDDLTYLMGSHKLKAGGQVILNDLSRQVSNSFNGQYYYANPGSGVSNFDPTTATPYAAKVNTLPTNQLSAKDDQIGFYAQDEWKPDEHWTLNYGLRWDFETNANNNSYVTPANIVAALQAYSNWTAAGINPANYISTGGNRKPQFDEFQPRAGVSYDVYGDKNLILFGGFGRYYDRSLFIEGAIETLTNGSTIPMVNFNNPAKPCVEGQGSCLNWDPSYLNPNNLRAAIAQKLPQLKGGSVWLLNNKTPAPYSDEFDVGVRKRFGGIQSSVTVSYVNSHNIFQYVRGNRQPDGTYTSQGDGFIEDNFPASGQLSGYSGKLDIGESSGKAHLWALYVQVEKPFTDLAKWGFVSSLTIQQARSNDASPSIFNQDEFYNGGSQTAYGWGNVAGIPWWIWNTSANWRLPYGLVASTTVNLNSGPSFGHVSPVVGANGQRYANFSGVYWPKDAVAYKRVDLRLSKSFKMPYAESQELTLFVEGFNVFNSLNRTYSAWTSGGGVNPPRIENSQLRNDQREFQAGVKYKF